MTLYNNIDSFKSTSESLFGDAYNIYNDGSAITLDSEPSIEGINFNAQWTIELYYKSASLTQECLLSIDDGAGGRYLDVMRKDGDKIVVYYEGVETSLTYTTATLPDTEWTHCVVGYKNTDKTLAIASKELATSVTVTNDIVLTNATKIRFFRPVHVDDFYFNGHVDTIRISTYFLWMFLSNPTYNNYYASVPYVNDNWSYDSNTLHIGFNPGLDIDVSTVNTNHQSSRYHSICRYDNERVLVGYPDSWSGGYTKVIGLIDPITEARTFVLLTGTSARGMHFFERTNTAIYVNANTWALEKT